MLPSWKIQGADPLERVIELYALVELSRESLESTIHPDQMIESASSNKR